MRQIIKLKPFIQHYDWGNNSFIPSLLGEDASSEPCAELWMGAHKDGSAVLSETGESFRDFLNNNPDFAGCSAEDFPFLFKVLVMEKPLSIQCHPDKAQAEKGFAEKNPNYSDPNEKAEMFYALSDTTLLCGFRKEVLKNEETEALYSYLQSLYPGDAACEFAYKLNLLHLEAGEAIYIKPDLPHGYIKGCGIELMTNSNNVLRLGLTHKRVDKKELYKVMIQKAYEPDLLGSCEDFSGEQFFTPTGLKLSVMKDGIFHSSDESVRILLCTEGEARINDGFILRKGEVCAVSKDYEINVDADGTVFMAGS